MAVVLPIPYTKDRAFIDKDGLYVDARGLKKEEYLEKAKEFALMEDHRYVYLQIERKDKEIKPNLTLNHSPLIKQMSYIAAASFHPVLNHPSKAKDSKRIEARRMEEKGPSFIEYLYTLLRKYNYSDVECYTSSNLDRRLFAKFRKNGYTPNKLTIFALIIGCKLSLEEAIKLLEIAGYAFSPSLELDRFIKQRVIRQDYSNIHEVNLALFNLGLPPLGSLVR